MLQYKEKVVEAMVKEIYLRKDYLTNKKLETIYIGGGTPSLLTAKELNLIFEALNQNFNLSGVIEITLEANPDDISKSYLTDLKNTPINRFSLGVQSFLETDLKWMNRAHSATDALESVNLIKQLGFNNISIDLIYGTPGLTIKNWEKNLNTFYSLGINHLSSYCLTVEPKTALEKFINTKKYQNVDEELALKHFEILMETSQKNGFNQYEISNFAKPGYYALHNTNYWKGKHYLGIGPSAHSFNGDSRSWHVNNNQQYIKNLENNYLDIKTEILSTQNKFNEYIMTSLRTEWGIDLNYVKLNFNHNYLLKIQKSLNLYIVKGLLEPTTNGFKLTDKGKFLADGIASALFII